MARSEKNTSQNRPVSWWLVILPGMVFPPLGLYVLHRKLKQEAEQLLKNACLLLTVSLALTFLSLYAALKAYFAPWDSQAAFRSHAAWPVLLTGLGICLTIPCLFLIHQGIWYHRLKQCLTRDHITSLSDLSLVLNKPIPPLCDLIESMWADGLLPDFQPDYPKEALFPEAAFLANKNPVLETQTEKAPVKNRKLFTVNTLWILVILLGFEWPLGVLVFVLACILEYRCHVRKNNVILGAGMTLSCLAWVLLITAGHTQLSSTDPIASSLAVTLCLPALLLALACLLAWHLFEIRCLRLRRIAFLRETLPQPDAALCERLCGKWAAGKGAAKKS